MAATAGGNTATAMPLSAWAAMMNGSVGHGRDCGATDSDEQGRADNQQAFLLQRVDQPSGRRLYDADASQVNKWPDKDQRRRAHRPERY
jgi:hypothetical protein